MFSIVKICKIGTRYRSDHAPIKLELFTEDPPLGPGYWKLNVELLKSPEILKTIKKEISLIKSTYALTPYNPNYVDYCPTSNLEFMISDTLLWETLLIQLQGIFIRFATIKNQTSKKQEAKLSRDLDKLQEQYNINQDDISLKTKLEKTHEELVDIRSHQLNRAMIRARAKRIEFGEKPSRYFFQLEKSNYINKTIRELEIDDKSVITEPNRILNEMKDIFIKDSTNVGIGLLVYRRQCCLLILQI